jgi:signal transduction histidine kinase
MGGDLVYRRRGGWTRFELTLPVAPEAAASLAG